MLYNYGLFYHNLRDLPAEFRPDDRLLENDEALDRWYERFQADQARKGSGTKGKASYDLMAGPGGSADSIPQYRPEG